MAGGRLPPLPFTALFAATLLSVLQAVGVVNGQQYTASSPLRMDDYYGGFGLFHNTNSDADLSATWNDVTFMAGFALAGLDNQTYSGGASDILTQAYNTSSGVRLWSRLIGGSQGERALSLAVDASSGDVYVCGYTEGYTAGAVAFAGLVSLGGADAVLLRYSVNGTLAYARLFGGSADEHANGVAFDTLSGLVVVAAYSESPTVTSGDGQPQTRTGTASDFYTIAYDSQSGAQLWSRLIGSTAADRGNGVAFDTESGIYVAGYAGGSFRGQVTSTSTYVQCVVKYNATGDVQWVQFFGPVDTSFRSAFHRIARDLTPAAAPNSMYLSGFAKGSSAYYNLASIGSSPSEDATFVLMNSTGSVKWAVRFGGTIDEEILAVAPDHQNNAVIVTGFTTSGTWNSQNNPFTPQRCTFIVKYDTLTGAVVWTKFISGPGNSWGLGLGINAYTTSNRIVLTIMKSTTSLLSINGDSRGPSVITNRFCPAIPPGSYCSSGSFPEPCHQGECAADSAILACPAHAICSQYAIVACQYGWVPFPTCTISIGCDSSPCTNGGVCHADGAVHSCDCVPGYSGVECQTQINECASAPCANGGTCADALNSFVCTCARGYSGAMCQTDVSECDSQPCANGGTCVDGVDSWSCVCAAGYSGVACQTEINECASNPCRSGGSCHDDVNGFTCECAPGYSGLFCQTGIDECASVPCQHGGTCHDQLNAFSCECPVGYSGLLCQTEINECASTPCQFGGTCADRIGGYECTCPAGYSGAQCQTDIDECASAPCLNGGTCVAAARVAAFTCVCANGFSGLYCQVNVDECASAPCRNGGSCADGANAYSCTCANDYSGANCEQPPGEPETKFPLVPVLTYGGVGVGALLLGGLIVWGCRRRNRAHAAQANFQHMGDVVVKDTPDIELSG